MMEFRALQSEELESWYDHVTHVFHGSRQYFMNHWANDPWQSLNGIRVAVEDGKIVSTVRVFLREMYLRGERVPVGGIGEVSTHPDYQRRGLATQLLRDAVEFMAQEGITMSSLHGSRSLYESLGWCSVTRYFAVAQKSAAIDHEFTIRPIYWESEEERARLASFCDGYARRFNGTFVRDDLGYWSTWVSAESHNAWLAESGGQLQGYLSVRQRKENIRVAEFAAAEALCTPGGEKHLLEAMVSHVMQQANIPSARVAWPAPIADGFSAEHIEESHSTKYRVVLPENLPTYAGSITDRMSNQIEPWDRGIPSHHVFWDTDGY